MFRMVLIFTIRVLFGVTPFKSLMEHRTGDTFVLGCVTCTVN